jgi:hypothetical protein
MQKGWQWEKELVIRRLPSERALEGQQMASQVLAEVEIKRAIVAELEKQLAKRKSTS